MHDPGGDKACKHRLTIPRHDVVGGVISDDDPALEVGIILSSVGNMVGKQQHPARGLNRGTRGCLRLRQSNSGAGTSLQIPQCSSKNTVNVAVVHFSRGVNGDWHCIWSA